MTIKELAKLVGASPAAVSLVLNGKWHKKVNQQTAAKVQSLARKHHFSVNIAARSLVMQRHFRVAVCADSSSIDHPVMGAYSFHELLGIISAELSKSSFSIDLIRLDAYQDDLDELRRRLSSHCDGVMFVSPETAGVKRMVSELDPRIPYLVVDSNLRSRSLNYVYTDMRAGAKGVVNALLQRKHRRIGVVRGERQDERFRRKVKGYEQALRLHGIGYAPELVLEDYPDDAFLYGMEAAETLLGLKKPPTAVFCTDNSCALGVVQYANSRSIGIPDELEVVGFGDEAISMFSSPRLTYLRRPIGAMARKAVAVLLGWIDDRDTYEPLQCKFDEELVVQETALVGSSWGLADAQKHRHTTKKRSGPQKPMSCPVQSTKTSTGGCTV